MVKKILFVISSLGIGGEQRVASVLTHEFVERGNSVDILVLDKKAEKELAFDERVNITYADVSQGSLKKVKKLFAVKHSLKKGYDLIIGFALIPSVICPIAALGTKIPVIVCERNDPLVYGLGWKMMRHISYLFATGAVFQTEDALESLPFLKKKKRVIIPNPIDVSKLPEVWSGQRNKRIINTARLTTVKNQIVLIKAFEQIEKEFPEYSVHIYGDGPEKDNLTEYISEHSLSDRVILHGAKPDILNEIYKDEVFVLPSKNEGFPNSLAEALALGMICISTDCRIGGPHDMLYEKNRGILVKTNDVDELKKALQSILHDDARKREYSRNAIEIRKELDSRSIANKWIDFFETLDS